MTSSHTENFYRSFFEFSFEAMLLTAPNGSIFAANPAACELFGRTEIEICKAGRAGLVDNSSPHLKDLLAERTHTGRIRGELIFIRGDGTRFPGEVSSAQFADTDGIVKTIMIIRDLSEIKQAELAQAQALHEANKNAAEVEAILASQDDAILVYDMEMNVRRANSSFIHIYGFDPVGLNVGEIIQRVSCQNLDGSPLVMNEQPTPRALQGEITTKRAYSVKRRDGFVAVVEVSSRPLNVGGVIIGSVTIWHDITDKSIAESRLQDSEQRFRSLANSAPVLIWIAGTDKLCYWFNDVWLNFTGRSMQQEIGNGWAEGIHPEDFQRCLDIYITSFDKRQKFTMEYRLRRHDGEFRWIHDNGVPRFDCQNNFIGYIGSCIDVTEQKQLFEKLQESERRWKFALEGSEEGVWERNLLTNEIRVSKRFEEILGYAEGEFGSDGNKWRESIHPEDKASTLAGLKKYLENDAPVYFNEYRLLSKNGDYKWVLSRGMATERDAEGRPIKLIGTLADISNRKLAEVERDRLLAIILEAPDFIATSDMQAHLKFLNPAGARLVGLSENVDLTYLEIKDMHPEWATKRVLEEALPIVLREGFWQGEVSLLHRDGHEIPVSQLLLVHRDANGVPQQLSTIMRDISSFKQAEQALKKAKESAESLSHSKSEFLANMSHEIRTPMNAIIGLSNLALNEEMSDHVRDYLTKINSSSEGLLSILNDILDFSKIEVGKLSIENTNFNFAALLEDLYDLFLPHIQAKKLEFTIKVDSDVPENLIGDALRIQQILSNLIGNAIKFTNQGEINILVQLLELKDSNAKIVVSVRDTGIGISDVDKVKLFQPFSQGDTSITRRYGGTGLGLAISNRLLQLMGSCFHLDSELGKGSNFGFELLLGVSTVKLNQEVDRRHIERKAGSLAADLRKRGEALKGRRILVVEDNVINQQVVCEFLKLSGVVVDIANNGKEALSQMEQNIYDAVLMDVHMPEMGGMEATEIIRQQIQFASLPIIALTAGVTQEERERCKASGMNDFIAKPINPEELLSVLCHWISKQKNTIILSIPMAPLPPAISNVAVVEQTFQSLQGFNLTNLLEMVGGEESLVKELLFDFSDEIDVILANMETFIKENKLSDASDLMHRIKGTSGNLGAMKLHEIATVMDASLKADRFDLVNYQKFKTIMLQIKKEISSLK